jgi:hypothetical protein
MSNNHRPHQDYYSYYNYDGSQANEQGTPSLVHPNLDSATSEPSRVSSSHYNNSFTGHLPTDGTVSIVQGVSFHSFRFLVHLTVAFPTFDALLILLSSYSDLTGSTSTCRVRSHLEGCKRSTTECIRSSFLLVCRFRQASLRSHRSYWLLSLPTSPIRSLYQRFPTTTVSPERAPNSARSNQRSSLYTSASSTTSSPIGPWQFRAKRWKRRSSLPSQTQGSRQYSQSHLLLQQFDRPFDPAVG